jgi:hypothetical protein
MIGLTAMAIVVLLTASCLDPTDTPFMVTIRNDTRATVTAKQCKSACDAIAFQKRLDPGEEVASGVHYRKFVPRWFVIEGADRRVLGCVPIPQPGPSATAANDTVLVSQMIPCPADAFPAGTPTVPAG